MNVGFFNFKCEKNTNTIVLVLNNTNI